MTDGGSVRVLIVDDEPLARAALADILASRRDIEHFDSAHDSIDAFNRLAHSPYDVLFLDINMPEGSGIELLDRLKESRLPIPSIVFVTAHDEHAVAAFEKHAVDYVLKPFSTQRIDEALDVAVRRTAEERAARLLEVLPQLRPASRPQSHRIAIKSKGRIILIDPGDVIAVKAEGNYVLLQRESGSYLLRESISEVAEKLKLYGFIRIHRSILVNTSFVEEIRPWPTGEYGLRVRGGKEFSVTRTYKKNLKSLADFWIGTDTFLAD
jgi:two-component system, LytTR family, response regulator